MHFGIMLERGNSVLFGFKRKRIKEDIFADAIAKQTLHSYQISGNRRANTFTLCIEHVEDHDLVFDKVIVELNLASFVRCQNKIREVALPDPLTRRYLFELPRGIERLRSRQQWHNKRSRP